MSSSIATRGPDRPSQRDPLAASCLHATIRRKGAEDKDGIEGAVTGFSETHLRLESQCDWSPGQELEVEVDIRSAGVFKPVLQVKARVQWQVAKAGAAWRVAGCRIDPAVPPDPVTVAALLKWLRQA